MTRLITRVFTIPEAAEFLRVDVDTVNALIEGGKLRTFSSGAYRHTTLEAISDYIHEAEVDLPTTIADVCLRFFTSPTTEGRAPAIVRYAAEAFGLDLKETSVSATAFGEIDTSGNGSIELAEMQAALKAHDAKLSGYYSSLQDSSTPSTLRRKV